jgi:hypothetical protein
MDERRSIILK